MNSPLPEAAAVDEGVDPAGILALIEALERRRTVDPHGLIVMRRGRVIAQGWWKPYTATRPTLMYSLSKAFTATALGLAAGEGLLDLDRPALDYLRDLDTDPVGPRMRGVTLRQLASMRSGHLHETWEIVAGALPDPLDAFFALEPSAEPGTLFCYNQPPILAVSAAVQAVSGETLTQFLGRRLFEPLGIRIPGWQQFPAGRDIGFTGLFTTVDALARLGELYRSDGVWNDQQVLPVGWAGTATSVHADSGREAAPDWQQGYGLGFWITTRGFRADGGWGQFSIVLPEQEMTIAITSAAEWMQDVLDDVWRHLLPAVDRPGTDADQRRLDQRLNELVLVPAPGTQWSPDLGDLRGTFRPLSGRCPAQPSLTSIRIGDGVVELWEGERVTAVQFGSASDETVVVGAAGHAAGLISLDLHFVQTPHRMWVVLEPRTEAFTAGWVTQPLHTSTFAEMRAPGPGAPALHSP